MTTATVSKPIANVLKQVLGREFKINGQIGEPGQKDKLTFVSLVRQIESALLKGYPEAEVTDTVIRATLPVCSCEVILKLSVTWHCQDYVLFWDHTFRRKVQLSFNNSLTTIVQEPEESPQSFLISQVKWFYFPLKKQEQRLSMTKVWSRDCSYTLTWN